MTRFIWHAGERARYLFHYTRSEDAEGLLDIEVDPQGRPFEEAAAHHWLIRATDRVALGDRIIGIAIFDESRGEWMYDEDLVDQP